MPIIVDGKGDFETPEAGLHNAVCSAVVELGMQTDTYMGKQSTKRKVMLLWEIEEVMQEGDYAGDRFLLFKEYTASLSDKANLRKDLESWRGKAFSDEELDGFDIEILAGKPCTLTVVMSEKGKAKVDGITLPMKGVEKLIPNKPGYVPDWIKKKINKEPEYEEVDVPPGDSTEEPNEGDLGIF